MAVYGIFINSFFFSLKAEIKGGGGEVKGMEGKGRKKR
jgi:hypothetical protein